MIEVERAEILPVGFTDGEVTIAVFLVHDRDAGALDMDAAMRAARDDAVRSWPHADIDDATQEQALRLFHTDLGDGKWMSTVVYGVDTEACRKVLRTLHPKENTDGELL